MYAKIFKALLPFIILLFTFLGAGILAYNLGKTKCETAQKESNIEEYQKETEYKSQVEKEISGLDYSIIVDRLLSKYCRQPCN